jgi:hypothetical protein
MSITSSALRFALTAAALCAAGSIADARPRRLVIMDFDGPRQLADTGRSSVVAVLGEHYDVVATKRWEQARAAASQQAHGPAQWSRAAKQSGVDAVIEGWVQDEGRRKILNVIVREASNGREFDTISVRLDGKNGISVEGTRKLQASLDEVLDWIEPGHNEPTSTIPVVNVKRLGSIDARPAADASGDAAVRRPGGRRVIDDDATASEPRSRTPRGSVAEADPVDDAAPARGSKARPSPAAAGSGVDPEPEPADEPAREARPTAVAATTGEPHDIEILFPQHSDEYKTLHPEKVHVPKKTVRFMVDAGPYLGSRSLIWDAPADSEVQQFAGVSSKGVVVNAAVYPFPAKVMDSIMSGFGFTGSIHHSMGSSVISDEGETINEYVLNQNGWELGAHYRTAIGSLVAIDGGAYYGNQTYEIVDASELFETPDTKYSYLGLSGHLDLAITDRATVGFGARYFTVLDSGDLQSTEFFGPASAGGLGLDASFVIPLPERLFVRGQLQYQKIDLELSGGGKISEEEAVTAGADSLITGNLNLGIAF